MTATSGAPSARSASGSRLPAAARASAAFSLRIETPVIAAGGNGRSRTGPGASPRQSPWPSMQMRWPAAASPAIVAGGKSPAVCPPRITQSQPSTAASTSSGANGSPTDSTHCSTPVSW